MENYAFNINMSQTLYMYRGIKIIFRDNDDYHLMELTIIDNGQTYNFTRCYPIFKRGLIILAYGECRDDCDELGIDCITDIYSVRHGLLDDFKFPSKRRNSCAFLEFNDYKKKVIEITMKKNLPRCIGAYIFTFITTFYL